MGVAKKKKKSQAFEVVGEEERGIFAGGTDSEALEKLWGGGRTVSCQKREHEKPKTEAGLVSENHAFPVKEKKRPKLALRTKNRGETKRKSVITRVT